MRSAILSGATSNSLRTQNRCPLCREPGKFERSYAGYDLHFCRVCDLAFNVYSEDASVADLFAQRYVDSVKASPWLQRYVARHRLETVLKYAPGRMLEVGCGTGYFISEAGLYFSVTGLDNSAVVAEAAGSIAPTATIVLGETLPPGPFDVICGFHVFEHIPDPVEFARHCKARLSRGGILYLRRPNRESSWARLRGKDFYLKGHCSHFSPSSLKRCLKLGGFERVNTWTDSSGIRWFASFTQPIWSLGSAAAKPINKSAYGGNGTSKRSLVRLKQAVLSCMHAGEITLDLALRPVWHSIAAHGRGEELVVLAQ